MIGLSVAGVVVTRSRVRAGAALGREKSKAVTGLGSLRGATTESGEDVSWGVAEEAEADGAEGFESLGVQVKVLGFFEGGAPAASVDWSCARALPGLH